MISPPSLPPARRIYVCSKIADIPLWQSLRQQGVPIISRWIDLTAITEKDTAAADHLWQLVREDIATATHLLVFQQFAQYQFKGALAECGMALAPTLPIAMVSPMSIDHRRKKWGTWVRCSNVTHYFKNGLPKALADLGYPNLNFAALRHKQPQKRKEPA